MPEKSVGIVLGTFGSVAYIWLQLECLKRHEPDVKILVHDDASQEEDQLRGLAMKYGAEFYTTGERLAPMCGDISAFYQGLRWAERNNIDLLVKASRRTIAFRPWSDTLREMSESTGYTTFSSVDVDAPHPLGFRSDWCGMDVNAWCRSSAMRLMEDRLNKNEGFTWEAEEFYHGLARSVHAGNRNDLMNRFEGFFKRADTWDGFCLWYMIGVSRLLRRPGMLQWQANPISDYASLAQRYKLPLEDKDFEMQEGTF